MSRKKRVKSLSAAGTNIEQQEEDLGTCLATILLANGLAACPDESVSLAEALVAEIEESNLSRNEACISSFQDYFSMSRETAMVTLSSLLDLDVVDKEKESDVSSQNGRGQLPDIDEDTEVDNDGQYLGEGECELCERFIRLTQHHLIPKSTWPRILPRLTNAAEALSNNDINRATLILGPGLAHLMEQLTSTDSNRAEIKAILQTTCTICGPCHAHIHRTHDNMTLATSYSTTELLLNDDKIRGFCKWASKQRAGKYSHAHVF